MLTACMCAAACDVKYDSEVANCGSTKLLASAMVATREQTKQLRGRGAIEDHLRMTNGIEQPRCSETRLVKCACSTRVTCRSERGSRELV